MEDYLQRPNAAKSGSIMHLPGTSVEDVFRSGEGLATSPMAKRPALGGTWTTPQSTLDMTKMLSPELT
jgi:hypothetical protein